MSAALTTQLIGFINATYTPREAVGPETELVRSEIVDSYGIVDLIEFIEQTCAIRVPDEEVRPDNFRTVAAMVAFLENLGPAQ